MNRLAALLRDPDTRNLDVDGSERLDAHRIVLGRKPMLRAVFREFHDLFHALDARYFSGEGVRLEIGGGVAPMRDSFSDVWATDIVPSSGLDRVIDAQNMDLLDGSVRTIFGQNCFHHFPRPELFFRELERVVAPGGGAILLEPYHGPAASFLFKRLFSTEGYDKQFPSWETPATGPMNGANQALSYIVFKRDRAEFERRFPGLKIVHEQRCGNWLMYLLSGGLNFRQLWPDWARPVLTLLQFMLSPLNRWLALHHVVVIRRVQ